MFKFRFSDSPDGQPTGARLMKLLVRRKLLKLQKLSLNDEISQK